MKITRTTEFKETIKALKEVYRVYGVTGIYKLLHSIEDDTKAFKEFTIEVIKALRRHTITLQDKNFLEFMFGVTC